ncbi:MAG: rhomboid family intramembrane serine protease, partial [Bacteroidetes bacterium]|nr:rhomboid family intramembrane serine protease [Bacteroidota bacterium]
MFSLTIAIIIITVVTSLAAWQNQELFNKFKLNSYMIYHNKEWWRPITCTLVHADYMHLAFNMISFYFFGQAVEGAFVAI